MKTILFFAAVFAVSGPTAEPPRAFVSAEQCEAIRAQIVKTIPVYNSTDTKDKIVSFVAVCVKEQSAKQGVEG